MLAIYAGTKEQSATASSHAKGAAAETPIVVIWKGHGSPNRVYGGKSRDYRNNSVGKLTFLWQLLLCLTLNEY
ncbi:hypothetical protein RJ55_06815 [Drechmeria coniospora]|nr:hypothetical protein RJ55_06815 [Drechmeria coniospora]